jgi:hypothetical protein
MKTRFTVALVLTFLGITCGDAWGQAFRFVPRIPVRLPIIPPIHSPIHPPIHVPQSTDPSKQNQPPDKQSTPKGGGIVIPICIGLGLFTILALIINAAMAGKFAGGVIRIVTTPPGEAPQSVREAWIGLELPLAKSRDQGKKLAVMGVRSWEGIFMTGYAVEGRVALEYLAARSPTAAAWWRENVPHVLKSGFQFVFPVENCVRLD